MFAILLALHVIICLALIGLILLQPGEGRGLSETFGGGMAESLLGSKATSFLTKSTAVFAVLFFVVCISLTVLTAKQTQSVFEGVKTTDEVSQQLPTEEAASQPVEPVTAE
jgi:preprotein translocase subunit SecG